MKTVFRKVLGKDGVSPDWSFVGFFSNFKTGWQRLTIHGMLEVEKIHFLDRPFWVKKVNGFMLDQV